MKKKKISEKQALDMLIALASTGNITGNTRDLICVWRESGYIKENSPLQAASKYAEHCKNILTKNNLKYISTKVYIKTVELYEKAIKGIIK